MGSQRVRCSSAQISLLPSFLCFPFLWQYKFWFMFNSFISYFGIWQGKSTLTNLAFLILGGIWEYFIIPYKIHDYLNSVMTNSIWAFEITQRPDCYFWHTKIRTCNQCQSLFKNICNHKANQGMEILLLVCVLSFNIVVVQSLSHVWFFAAPWTIDFHYLSEFAQIHVHWVSDDI